MPSLHSQQNVWARSLQITCCPHHCCCSAPVRLHCFLSAPPGRIQILFAEAYNYLRYHIPDITWYISMFSGCLKWVPIGLCQVSVQVMRLRTLTQCVGAYVKWRTVWLVLQKELHSAHHPNMNGHLKYGSIFTRFLEIMWNKTIILYLGYEINWNYTFSFSEGKNIFDW